MNDYFTIEVKPVNRWREVARIVVTAAVFGIVAVALAL